jgi:hypothetical protein
MGRLVKIHNGQVCVAHNYVATPEYTLYVADYANGATPPHGWTYYAEDVEAEDFAQPWRQPSGDGDAYPLGATVRHNGTIWTSTVAGNVWEPGVSGWQDADTVLPTWVRPTGAHDAYVRGAVVRYQGHKWESLIDANVWPPDVKGWRKMALLPPDGAVDIPAWVQPTGAHDAYQIGDRVTHRGSVWVSAVPNNVWEPGVFGWTPES